jgi:hypothetical protein
MPSSNRPTIERWTREHIEDQYHKLHNDHEELKIKYNEQHEKLKKYSIIYILIN